MVTRMRTRWASVLVACAALFVGGCNPSGPQTPAVAPDSIRVATWNLRQFSDNRLADLGRIVRIINDAKFDLIAVQEIKGQGDEVDRLLNALGAPWRSTSLSGRTGNSERFAFLYKADRLAEVGRARFVESGRAEVFDRRPYQATFRCGQFDFTLISVHLHFSKPDQRRLEAEALAAICQELARASSEKDIIVVGDFNEQRSRPNLDVFRARGWETLIAEPTNLGSKEVFDNIILDRRHTREWTGKAGVVRFDEMYFANDDKAASRDVSDHRPAWADFSTLGPDDD